MGKRQQLFFILLVSIQEIVKVCYCCFDYFPINWGLIVWLGLLGWKRFGSWVQGFCNTSLIMKRVCSHWAFLLPCSFLPCDFVFSVVSFYHCNCPSSAQLSFLLSVLSCTCCHLACSCTWSLSQNSDYLSHSSRPNFILPLFVIAIVFFLQWHEKMQFVFVFSTCKEFSKAILELEKKF